MLQGTPPGSFFLFVPSLRLKRLYSGVYISVYHSTIFSLLILNIHILIFRSMPTSAALDVVAKNLGLKFFEVHVTVQLLSSFYLLQFCNIVRIFNTSTVYSRFQQAGNFLAI